MKDRTPPAGWFPFEFHRGMDPVPWLEFSQEKDRNGKPLWERPVVVCTHDTCGSSSMPQEAGVSTCLQHFPGLIRERCELFRKEKKERERPLLEVAQRRRKRDAEAREIAEQQAGWVSPPDRFNFRGKSARFVGGGLPSLGENAR